ncbi:MAG: AMP-binding protein, partial [Micromonosporaceae bacterium]
RGLGVERDLSRNPLVQVLFNMYNFAQPRLALPGVVAEPVPAGLPGSLFDLTLYLAENVRRGWDLQVVYNPDLYDTQRIDALLAGYLTLTANLVQAPQAAVGAASLRSSGRPLPDPAEELPRWSGPGPLERIAAIAATRPHALAVTGEGGDIDYAGLVDRQRRTTAAIRSAGIAAGETVGILATRHIDLPGLMLGVLASGARWAMLDAALPPARLAALARAAGCVGLLACPGVRPPIELADLPVVDVGAGPAELAPASADRGYLSFTSGTSGVPKVVVATEQPLAHFLDWYPRAFGLRESDRFAMLAGVAHDPLLRDIFTPLVLGAQLHVPPAELTRDPVRLADWLGAHQVTVVHLTPQLVRALTSGPGLELPALRLVGCGGDQLTYVDVEHLHRLAPHARVVNLYGTTETPQAQAHHEAGRSGHGPVPVGRGIEGSQLLVLGPKGQPAGVGELGEVVIRGRHLAEGYRPGGPQDPERFSAGRFSVDAAGVGRYQTGDLGRYEPDGNVTLTGRDDDQVKVRGFRLELGEVEAALLAHPKVRTAAVVAGAEHQETALHGYVVSSDAGLTVESLRSHLTGLLPGHAVPAYLTILPAMPLTPNGKVDRRALPRALPRPATGIAHQPATPTERLIAGVWREVLGLPRVDADDNFFEIGGHSLAVVAVQARLAALVQREVDIVDLFRHPNIRALAAHLDGGARKPALDRAAQRVAARRDRSGRSTTAARAGSAPDDGGPDR